MRECFEERLGQVLDLRDSASHHPGFDIQPGIIIRFVASALFAMLACWLENGARESPEEVQAIFSRLVGRGLAGSEKSTPSGR